MNLSNNIKKYIYYVFSYLYRPFIQKINRNSIQTYEQYGKQNLGEKIIIKYY